MSAFLATLALSALLAWLALPALAWLAQRLAGRRDALEPGGYERALFAALGFALLLFLAPWIRLASVYATVLCASSPSARADLPEPGSLAVSAGALVLTLVSLGLLGRGRQLRALARLAARAHDAPPPVQAQARTLALRLGVDAPRVAVSAEVQVPCLVGLRAPTLLLPEGMLSELDRAALELVLLHELAHHRRRDTTRALVAALLALPLTGHPAARWVLAELALTRELAVDRLVAPFDPRRYAGLLLEVAARRPVKVRALPVAMAVSQVELRLQRLTSSAPVRRASLLPVFTLGAVLLALVLAAPQSSAEALAPAVVRAACAAAISEVEPVLHPECAEASCDSVEMREVCEESCVEATGEAPLKP